MLFHSWKTCMQELEMCNMSIDQVFWQGGTVATLPITALKPLQHLTSLDLLYVSPEPLQDVFILTQLQQLFLIFEPGDNTMLTAAGAPGSCLPPSVLHLTLGNCELNVNVLTSLTTLTSLSFHRVSLHDGARGAGKLLGFMQNITTLDTLDLDVISPMPPATPDYAALTPSSKLEDLRLRSYIHVTRGQAKFH